MHIGTSTRHGGMWVTLDDNSKVHCRIEPESQFAEFNFFGSVEVSLGMSEATLVRCRDLFTKALQDMRDGNEEQSWMHKAAPTD